MLFLDAQPTVSKHWRTHTHPFNGPLSGTTQVSRYQKGKTNLDFIGGRDSEWQWHQLGHMQIYTSLETTNHASTPPLSFLQAGCPSCRPTNSVKALKDSAYLIIIIIHVFQRMLQLFVRLDRDADALVTLLELHQLSDEVSACVASLCCDWEHSVGCTHLHHAMLQLAQCCCYQHVHQRGSISPKLGPVQFLPSIFWLCSLHLPLSLARQCDSTAQIHLSIVALKNVCLLT